MDARTDDRAGMDVAVLVAVDVHVNVAVDGFSCFGTATLGLMDVNDFHFLQHSGYNLQPLP
jgi:hypothetical protein